MGAFPQRLRSVRRRYPAALSDALAKPQALAMASSSPAAPQPESQRRSDVLEFVNAVAIFCHRRQCHAPSCGASISSSYEEHDVAHDVAQDSELAAQLPLRNDRSLERWLAVLDQAQEQLLTDRGTTTKREIYYSDPALFGKKSLHCRRW